jgi:hypothetical protein
MDALYTTKQKRIILPKIKDTINLYLFGDVHRDAENCDADRWKYFLKQSKKDDEESTYYLGLGDYHDFASYSEQKAIKNSGLHETTMLRLNKMVRQDVEFFTDEIKHMKGKVLGFVEGNHTWEFENGQTATQLLCEKMETEYLGWITHYTLTFQIHSRVQNVYIVACHGKAGGKRAGASINQVEDLKVIFPAADIYVMGHDHNRGAWPIDVLLPYNGQNGVRIKQKRQFLCRSGSFLKGYESGKGGYVASRLLRPADLGALKLIIGFHRSQKDGDDRMITDIKAVI